MSETRHDRFGIVITAKMRHGDLWAAAKKMGNSAALARYLALSPSVVGDWINLELAPSFEWLESPRGREVLAQLDLLINKTADELWPVELRAAIKGGEISKRIERRHEIEMAQLAYRQEERLLLPSPEDEAAARELDELAMGFLDTLSPRERRVIVLRFGLEGEKAKSFEEVGAELRVTKERVRQIEIKALRKLRDLGAAVQL